MGSDVLYTTSAVSRLDSVLAQNCVGGMHILFQSLVLYVGWEACLQVVRCEKMEPGVVVEKLNINL